MNDLITKIWESDKKVLHLREKLNETFYKSDVRTINCQQTYGSVKTGFFTIAQDSPKIDICTEYHHDVTSLSRLIQHELVHVYDFKVKKLDLKRSKLDLIRSEIRAYSYSGYCEEIWHNFDFLRNNCLKSAVGRSVFYHKVDKSEEDRLWKIIELEVQNEKGLIKDLKDLEQ